ncbi:Pogo transposable element with KRAB domainlike [Phytophthora palmivora]|uniref:Pogo transposable element with KRAB domainlike n=1 Tax=Phytophthora palmivora TaxID=4796 RepID=A0A2P4Y8N6_9STRA|nr:Pogo transposable element with KRAB domainlike [Phytophthora palmivora]
MHRRRVTRLSTRVLAIHVCRLWQSSVDGTVNNSIEAAGFGDYYMKWHVAQHDVYGETFCEKWEGADATQEVSVTSSNLGVPYAIIHNLLAI